MKINDAFETNLHVIPKNTNAIPTQPIDATQLLHVSNLHLGDPKFNVTGRIDILVGADVLEEAMLVNRIKDKNVVIRESIFVWIVYGPVQKPEFEDENPNFANASSIVFSGITEDLILEFSALESVPDWKQLSHEEKNAKVIVIEQ